MGISRTNVFGGSPIPIAKSSDFSAAVPERGAAYICSATLVVTLPSASGNSGLHYYIVNAGTGMVRVSTLIRLAPGETCRVVADGTSWYVIDARLHVPTSSAWRWPVTAHADDDEFWSADGAGWTEVDFGTGGAFNADYNDIPSHVLFEVPGTGDADTAVWLHKNLTSPGSTMLHSLGVRIAAISDGQMLGVGIMTSDLADGVVMTIGKPGGSHVARLYKIDTGGWNQVDSSDIGAAAQTGDFILHLARSSNLWQGSFSVGESSANTNYIPSIGDKTITAAKLVLIANAWGTNKAVVSGIDFVRRVA